MHASKCDVMFELYCIVIVKQQYNKYTVMGYIITTTHRYDMHNGKYYTYSAHQTAVIPVYVFINGLLLDHGTGELQRE